MNKRILIVDDEPDILKTIELLLEQDGYEVHTAGDGEEGLKKIDEVRPDLLLLDLRLPGKGGFQIAKEIKSKDEYKDIPIIILSGMANDASRHIAAKGGAVEFIEKPIDTDKLKFHIKDLLSK